jgi:hypothetical protein
MFELIGLLFATTLLFISASLVAAFLVGLTWLVLRKTPGIRKRILLAAALIPIASAAYLWLCLALLPGESLFGDIDQPLPNGYTVKALGKMPDFASIFSPKLPYSQSGPSECVGKLAVYGPFVVGQYSHPFGTFQAKENEPFFVFDTRNGKNIDLPQLTQVETLLGRRVILTEVQFFRSQELEYRRQKKFDTAVMFGPPIIAFVIFSVFVIRIRTRTLPPASNIYT